MTVEIQTARYVFYLDSRTTELSFIELMLQNYRKICKVIQA